MKLRTILLSMSVVAMLFASCDDSKKKEAEAKAAEEMKMQQEADSLMKVEEDAKMMQADYDSKTVAAIAMGNENFSTLVTAVQAAELADALKAEGPITVFAPTNDAFAKVPKASMDMLLMADNKAKLQDLLKYHVVSGKFMAADVLKAIKDNNNKYEVTTLQGENLTLSEKDGKVMVKDAKGGVATVVMADVDASNGVIHAVDMVLMPKK